MSDRRNTTRKLIVPAEGVRAAAVSDEEGDAGPEKTRAVSLLAYTGGIINVGAGPEVFDLEGMETPAGHPLLVEHERGRVAGYSTEADNDGKRLEIKGRVFVGEDEPEGNKVMARLDRGYPWQASVMVEVLEDELVPEGETRMINGRELTGPFWHDKRTRQRETSFVTLGADPDTRVAAAAHNEEGHMADDKDKAREEERARVKAIRAAFPDHPDFALDQIEAGSTLEQARAAHAGVLAEELKAEREARAAAEDAAKKAQADAEAARTARASASSGTATVPFSRDPRPAAGTGSSEGTARERFAALISKFEGLGLDRGTAVRRAAADDPKLHREFLEEHNPQAPMPAYLSRHFGRVEG